MLTGDEADKVIAFYRRIGFSYGHYSNPITNRVEREVIKEYMRLVKCTELNVEQLEKYQRLDKDLIPDERGTIQCYLRHLNDQGRLGHLLGVLEWLQSNQKQGIWEAEMEYKMSAIARCRNFKSIFVAVMDGNCFEVVPLESPEFVIVA